MALAWTCFWTNGGVSKVVSSPGSCLSIHRSLIVFLSTLWTNFFCVPSSYNVYNVFAFSFFFGFTSLDIGESSLRQLESQWLISFSYQVLNTDFLLISEVKSCCTKNQSPTNYVLFEKTKMDILKWNSLNEKINLPQIMFVWILLFFLIIFVSFFHMIKEIWYGGLSNCSIVAEF